MKVKTVRMDKETFLEWLERIARGYRERELDSYCRNHCLPYVEMPEDEGGFLEAIEDSYRGCNPSKTEVLLKSMPSELKGNKRYTVQVARFLRELKKDKDSDEGWQPVKADVIQLLFAHHPNGEIRGTGLEILVSNDIGSGTSDDITYKICERMGGCRFVFTSYLNAQDAEGYLEATDTCPVHSDIFYTNGERRDLWRKLDRLVGSL